MINGFPEHNIHLLSFKQSKMLYIGTLLFTFYSSCQCGVVEVILHFGAWSRVRTACVGHSRNHMFEPPGAATTSALQDLNVAA